MAQMGVRLAAWLLVGMVALLTGCGKQAGNGTGSNGGQPAAGGQPLVAKLGETVTVGGARVTVKAVEKQPSRIAPNQRIGLAVKAAVENGAGQALSITTSNWFVLHDPEGKTYRTAAQVTLPDEERLEGYLDAGKQKQGWFGYDVVPKEGEWTLVVKLPEQAGEARVKFRLPN